MLDAVANVADSMMELFLAAPLLRVFVVFPKALASNPDFFWSGLNLVAGLVIRVVQGHTLAGWVVLRRLYSMLGSILSGADPMVDLFLVFYMGVGVFLALRHESIKYVYSGLYLICWPRWWDSPIIH